MRLKRSERTASGKQDQDCHSRHRSPFWAILLVIQCAGTHKSLTCSDTQHVTKFGLRLSLLSYLSACTSWSQEVIHLKTRDVTVTPDPRAQVAAPLKRRSADRSHYLVKLRADADRGPLAAEGIVITGFVPGAALAVSAPDGVNWEALGATYVGRMATIDKISPMLTGNEAAWIVEFHADVDMDRARELASENGLRMVNHADLLPNQLVLEGELSASIRLAEWDEVAYIFPASDDLLSGEPLIACAGAMTEAGMVAQYARIGAGWPKADGIASLSYVFGPLTQRLPFLTVQAEIVRGLTEWTRHANIRLTPGGSVGTTRTIHIFFGRGWHGDEYAFDGVGRVLAHTFYPSPPNGEPIAGDMHFDDDETWRTGASIDLFSVALHEAGHALGLGHSDQPGAVMYPYYRMTAALNSDDIAGIRALYGAPESEQPSNPTPGPTPAPPPMVTITSPGGPVSTTSSVIAMRGMASGGTGTLRVTWTNNRGGSGVASGSTSWMVASVPLMIGDNRVAATVIDDSGRSAGATVSISRTAASDTTAPSIRITSPAASIVSTTADTITLNGTASDSNGVALVRWNNSTGMTGNAIGTTFWAIPLPLRIGNNNVVVRAYDAAGNSAWRSITVVRR